jgi:hypothetical protein
MKWDRNLEDNMSAGSMGGPEYLFDGKCKRLHLLLLTCIAFACLMQETARAQDASPKGQDSSGKAQSAPANADEAAAGDEDQPPEALPATSTAEDRSRAAWKLLTDALGDAKRPQNQVQALAVLGLLRSARSEKMITDAMKDPDLDVRTAAALAAGQTKDRNMTTPLRNLLDDKEPQVVFTAAVTLWKMNDKSGEDILMAVVDGERKTGPNLINGTRHDIYKDLHDPATLARMGAMQGVSLLPGPFGYGITAYEFIHKNGADLSRVSAIEQISQEKTDPIHKELVAALGDKDPAVRAAAAKALADYHDKATSMAIYKLFADSRQPVRLTAAAAYLRTTGIPGPPVAASAQAGNAKH